MADLSTLKNQDSNKKTALVIEQSLLTTNDITDLLQGYENTLDNKNLLLADASKSSDEKDFHDAYGYAAVVASMDRTEGDQEIYSKANHNAGYYGQQLLKQNAYSALFADVLTFFDKALMMRYDDSHKHQVTTNMYVKTILNYIQNATPQKGERIDLMNNALSKAQVSISKDSQDPEVRMICSNLASLLFNEAQKVEHKELAQFALVFNQESIKNTTKNIESRTKLREEIKKYLQDTEFGEELEGEVNENYDTLLEYAYTIQSLLEG